MKYPNMVPGTFRARHGRFIAHVEIEGKTEICHVKNTGRCKELLVPGAAVYCQHHDDPSRKTAWSLIAVQKGDRLINMDSQIPNKLAYHYVNQGGLGFIPTLVKAEKTYGTSRFDLYYEAGERKGFVEVKGVTLEQDGVARFPDAPTQRGRKHLLELEKAVAEGYEAWVLFVIQMSDIKHFEPNRATDPAFSDALLQVSQNGVKVKAVTCAVTPDSLTIKDPISVNL
ncbi:MAG: DNA/RNA nuclease SfsA [Oscillospiraceae bacterium]|nr:DNA/RNA nuclease SfsA [Oscillospiraceae bacterium]